MSRATIAVLVGSLRRESFNRRLATALARLAPPEVSFKPLEIGDLPLWNQDDDGHQAAPVQRLKSELGRTARLWRGERNNDAAS